MSKEDNDLTPEQEIEAVRKVVEASEGGPVGAWHRITGLQRLPIGIRRIQSICRKYAEEWGFNYSPAEYRPSGSGPFGRYSSKRAHYHEPYLTKKRERS